MINGYAWPPSILPGEPLRLYIAARRGETDPSPVVPKIRIKLFRQGSSFSSVGWLSGAVANQAPQLRPNDDTATPVIGPDPSVPWHDQFDQAENWPLYEFITPNLVTGVYVAVLLECDANGTITSAPNELTANGRDSKALFIVRNDRASHGDILFVLPMTTYQAYNAAGGACFYSDKGVGVQQPDGLGGEITKVTFCRPGGGAGGYNNFQVLFGPDLIEPDNFDLDPFDNVGLPRDGFARTDARFIRWLETKRYKIDYCLDIDIDVAAHQASSDPRILPGSVNSILAPYKLVMMAGHPEYVGTSIFSALHSYVDAGGNFAMFGGNAFWFRTHYSDRDNTGYPRVATCTKDAHSNNGGPNYDLWWLQAKNGKRDDDGFPMLPENALIGASSRNGAGWYPKGADAIQRPNLGFVMQHDDINWIYRATGLKDGDILGERDDLGREIGVIGNEADGVAFNRSSDGSAFATGEDGTAANFLLLGIRELTPDIHTSDDFTDPPRDPLVYSSPNHAITIGFYTSRTGGIVFNAGTIEWGRALENALPPASNAGLERFTMNVLDTLSSAKIPIAIKFNERHPYLGLTPGDLIVFTPDLSGIKRALSGEMPSLRHAVWSVSGGTPGSVGAASVDPRSGAFRAQFLRGGVYAVSIEATASTSDPKFVAGYSRGSSIQGNESTRSC